MKKIIKICDTCQHYIWYWDWCKKWKCEVDYRSVCDFWLNKN